MGQLSGDIVHQFCDGRIQGALNRWLKTDDNIEYTLVCANQEASNADDNQQYVLPQLVIEAAEMVGPQNADLHERGKRNSKY